MRNKKVSTAIFDSVKLYKELLHHEMERGKYEVLHSSSDIRELLSNFKKHPSHILLINEMSLSPEVAELLPEFHKHSHHPFSVLFYNCNHESQLSKEIKAKFETRIYYCNSSTAALYEMLDSIIATYRDGKPDEIQWQSVLLPPAHPFYHISHNRKYVEIIKMLSDGKDHFQIADYIDLSENTVDTYIRNMREETESRNVAHLISQAKDCHLI